MGNRSIKEPKPLFAIRINRGRISVRRSLGDFTLGPDTYPDSYFLTPLTIVFLLVAAITGFYISTFIDTQPELASKAGLLLTIGAVAMGGMFGFNELIAAVKKTDRIIVFSTEVSGKAISAGFVGLGFLVLAQIWVFTGLPTFPSVYEAAGLLVVLVFVLGEHPLEPTRTKLYAAGGVLLFATIVTAYFWGQHITFLVPSTFPPLNTVAATSYTLGTDPQLVGLFYTTSAIVESFFFQGLEYSMLMAILSNFDLTDATWPKHAVASFVTVITAGIMHFAVYQLAPETTLAVVLGFAVINFIYQVTKSLDAAIISHISLNILSSVGGSAFMLTGSALAPVTWAVSVTLAVSGFFMFVVRLLTRYYIRQALGTWELRAV